MRGVPCLWRREVCGDAVRHAGQGWGGEVLSQWELGAGRGGHTKWPGEHGVVVPHHPCWLGATPHHTLHLIQPSLQAPLESFGVCARGLGARGRWLELTFEPEFSIVKYDVLKPVAFKLHGGYSATGFNSCTTQAPPW